MFVLYDIMLTGLGYVVILGMLNVCTRRDGLEYREYTWVGIQELSQPNSI